MVVPKSQTKLSHHKIVKIIAIMVFIHGLLILFSGLFSYFRTYHRFLPNSYRLTYSGIIGLTLVYLSSLLNRRKQLAWGVAVAFYAFLAGMSIVFISNASVSHRFSLLAALRIVVFPIALLIGLVYYYQAFNVRSDIRNLTTAARLSGFILVLALVYGVIGFQLIDNRDFHQDMSLVQSVYYTVDQFGLTTNRVLIPYTDRAQIFLNSLSVVSALSITYAVVSLFQPLRARLTDQSHNRETTRELLERYGGSSEDYFKLWPPDKMYFFTPDRTAGLAYKIERGVALNVGDPFGNPRLFKELLLEFLDLCHSNDWLPAFIHTESFCNNLYKQHGFSLQKIGEEAIVDIPKFIEQVATNKYFRHISNKFNKQGFSTELLTPPHNSAVIDRLLEISNDWLKLPGGSERGFMLGYFQPDYLLHCPIMVVRDAAGTILAFINQIPSYKEKEANYDLLRYAGRAPGNINDFLLVDFIRYLGSQGFDHFNLGLCPLSGLEDVKNEEKTVTNNALRLVYSNGDRFYSFSGLWRFKSKYEPDWQDRYIAYRGGIRGFTRTINALNKAMSHRLSHH